MTLYNLVNPSALVTGQPEDISQVVANLQAIQTVLNGNLDDGNIKVGAGIGPSKLAGFPNNLLGFLRSDGAWSSLLTGGTAATGLFATRIAADTGDRWHARADGYQEWGPGNAAQDTNLYRVAASTLKTDNDLVSGGVMIANYTGSNTNAVYVGQQGVTKGQPAITFGGAGDTNLYRSAAGVLKTDGSLAIGGGLWLASAATGTIGTNQTYRFPVYNAAGALLGYTPVYS